jgi:ATP-dependent Clp protease ATP-binding subunit ClpX
MDNLEPNGGTDIARTVAEQVAAANAGQFADGFPNQQVPQPNQQTPEQQQSNQIPAQPEQSNQIPPQPVSQEQTQQPNQPQPNISNSNAQSQIPPQPQPAEQSSVGAQNERASVSPQPQPAGVSSGADNPQRANGEASKPLPTPADIATHLNEYVVGQEDAKRVLSVAVYNHYKRIKYASQMDGLEVKKSNILMIGPTGSGKTYLASTLAKFIGVPFSIADATVLITSVDLNRAIENILLDLIKAADFDMERAKSGIIFIDEIDKLVTGQNRLKGEGIQQALLKIIEGTVSTVHIQNKQYTFDTKDILFVVGGAFVSLASILQMRLADTRAGLLTETELVKKAETEDLSKFGLIPEFVGRLPIIVALAGLSREELRTILTEPKNAITHQFIKMFSFDGIELEFRTEALEKIADMAFKLRTGARSLRTIIEKCMRDIMYMVPSEKGVCKVVITPEVLDDSKNAIIERITVRTEDELVPLEPKKRTEITAR